MSAPTRKIQGLHISLPWSSLQAWPASRPRLGKDCWCRLRSVVTVAGSEDFHQWHTVVSTGFRKTPFRGICQMLVRQMCRNGSLGALMPTLILAGPYFFWPQGSPLTTFKHLEQRQSLPRRKATNSFCLQCRHDSASQSPRVQTHPSANKEHHAQTRDRRRQPLGTERKAKSSSVGRSHLRNVSRCHCQWAPASSPTVISSVPITPEKV